MNPALLALLAATLEVHVHDEAGRPSPHAVVRADWIPVATADPWNAPSVRRPMEVRVDAAGRARLEGRHAHDGVTVEVVAPGCHAVSRRLALAERVARFRLPACAPVVPGRRIQVALADLPAPGEEAGFDLELASWTAPRGVGRRADVHVTLSSDGLRLRFAEPGSGAYPCPRPGQRGFAEAVGLADPHDKSRDLRHPRHAPAEGYRAELVLPEAADSQWVLRLRRDRGWAYGVLDEAVREPGGRLRLGYVIGETDSTSLNFRGVEGEPVGR